MNYNEIAARFELWREYVDTSGLMTELEFDGMTVEEKVDFLIDCFGKE